MRIAIFGTFDVENYGDLLFPHVAQRRLRMSNMVVVEAISPVGGAPEWHDCFRTIGFEEYRPIYDGVLIGGGNIIRISPTNLTKYEGGATPYVAYANMWLGASNNKVGDAKICWNAPGVPDKFSTMQNELVRFALGRASYVSVRDNQSKHLLEAASSNQSISVVPDTVWEIDRLWTAEEIDSAYRQAYVGREPTVAFHLNSRYLAGRSIATVCWELDRIAKFLDARPLLIPIGPCHGDTELAERVSSAMSSRPIVIDQARSLKKITACIARSVAYVGSSMHGFIVASSFGVPALCVAKKDVVKFRGLESLLENAVVTVTDWSSARRLVEQGVLQSNANVVRRSKPGIERQLDAHWAKVTSTFSNALKDGDRLPPNEGVELMAVASIAQLAIEKYKKKRLKFWKRHIALLPSRGWNNRSEITSLFERLFRANRIPEKWYKIEKPKWHLNGVSNSIVKWLRARF